MPPKNRKPASQNNPAGNQANQIQQSGRTGDEESGSSQHHPNNPEQDERSGNRSKLSRGGHEAVDPADQNPRDRNPDPEGNKQIDPNRTSARNGVRVWVTSNGREDEEKVRGRDVGRNGNVGKSGINTGGSQQRRKQEDD